MTISNVNNVNKRKGSEEFSKCKQKNGGDMIVLLSYEKRKNMNNNNSFNDLQNERFAKIQISRNEKMKKYNDQKENETVLRW